MTGFVRFHSCKPALNGRPRGPLMEKILKDLLGYLRTWRDRVKQAQEAIPLVEKITEQTEWMRGMLEDRPREGRLLPTGELEARIKQTDKIIRTSLPMPPEVDVHGLT